MTNNIATGLLQPGISFCLEINFLKICPEIALKYFVDKMWFYMKYIVKNRG
jgi:hypothetical protein